MLNAHTQKNEGRILATSKIYDATLYELFEKHTLNLTQTKISKHRQRVGVK